MIEVDYCGGWLILAFTVGEVGGFFIKSSPKMVSYRMSCARYGMLSLIDYGRKKK